MKKICIILLLFLSHFSINANAQGLNKQSLVSQLSVDKQTIFIINGVSYTHFDSISLENELGKIDVTKIAEVTILKTTNNAIHSVNDAIIINYATLLPNKILRKKLKQVKANLSATQDSIIYTLNYNGTKIEATETRKTLKRLKARNIGYVHATKVTNDKNQENNVFIWSKEILTPTLQPQIH